MSSFKRNENIQKKECGPDISVSDNESSSVTLNKLPMKARKPYCNVKFQQRPHFNMVKLGFTRVYTFSYLCYKIYFVGTRYNRLNEAVLTCKSNRKAMNRNWSNQKANPALKTKRENE